MTAPRSRWLELALGVCAVVALGVGAVDLQRAFTDDDTLAISDFAVFRVGGELVLRGSSPYDAVAQQAVMAEVLGVERTGGHLAFLLPPHGALLFAPFARLPLGLAFVLFALFSGGLLTRLVIVLADLARADVRVVALLMCALAPLHVTFRLGQLAIVCALALAELARALRDRRDVPAGLALAALTLKPQFAPIAALYVVGLGRWPALGWAGLAFGALAAPTLLAPGAGAWVDWASNLGGLEHAFAVATPPYMVNARSVLARVLGDPEHRALASSIAWALFALAGAAALALGRRARSSTQPVRALPLALALGLLFSPHLFFHDLLAWCVPVALARGASDRGDGTRADPWDLLALAAPSALLVASALEPALGALLPIAPQLVVPLVAVAWLLRDEMRRFRRSEEQAS